MEFHAAIKKAKTAALEGGIPGMTAMSVQVLSLMWLRTTVNYQYKYGTNTMTALKTLYKQGGIPRFYRGLGPALIQGPLSRFGDTAANSGTLALLDSYENTKNLPIGVKTLAASISAAGFRIFLMPIDNLKTTLQVEGNLSNMVQKFKITGIQSLYYGAMAASAATFVGHYPWFFTYNYLNAVLPDYKDSLKMRLIRSAGIGFCASFISDCCSNSLRVIKTARQTSKEIITYQDVVRSIIKKEGVMGLLGRGLATKIITNGIQGLIFSVAWKLGQENYKK